MRDQLVTASVAALTGVIVALAVRPVLVRLPEPADPSSAAEKQVTGKRAYRDLATPGFVLTCSMLTILAQLLALNLVSVPTWPVWTVLATVGVLLAGIDARTTWLPLLLTRVGWALMLLALALSLVLGASPHQMIRAAAGGAIAGSLYLLIWAVTKGGFGFGDVRFAPLLGAATASESWTLLIWGLTLGTVIGAVHGGVKLIQHRPGGFPYAPSMLAGVYVALVVLHFTLMGRGP